MNRKKFKRFLVSFISVIFLLAIIPAIGQTQVPEEMNYQGYLTDSTGTPIDGTVSMEFSLYDIDTGGTALWTETQSVSVVSGYFNVDLGEVNPLTLSFDIPYYLGVKAGADPEMTPRTALTSTGYAFRAKSVEIDSDTLNDLSCANGEVAKWNGSSWACAADDDTDTDTTYSGADFAVSNQTCTGSQKVSGIDASGNVICANDVDTVNDADADPNNEIQTLSIVDHTVALSNGGSSVTVPDNDTVGDLSCTSGEVAKWNGSAWVCSSDDAGLGDGHSLDAADGSPLDAVFVDNDGNVGIGTTSPSQTLEVVDTKAAISIKSTSSSDYAALSLSNAANSTWSIVVPSATGGPASTVGKFNIFNNDAFEWAFTIDNTNSNVGIGTTSPGSALEVIGTVTATAFAGNGSGLTGLNYTEIDPTVLASVKDGVDWTELAGIPAGFADGADDGITTETDPTVLASVKDGVDWTELAGIPAGFADGTDDGITTETDPQVGTNTSNYVPKWDGSALVTGTIYDTGSNVGIGTTTPTHNLEVQDGVSGYLGYFHNDNNASGQNALGIYATGDAYDTGTGSGYGGTFFSIGGSTDGDAYGTRNTAYAYGSSNAYGVYSVATQGTTTGMEYAFYGIGDGYFSGNVGIGTSSPSEKLDINGNLFMSGGDIKTDRWLLSDTNTGIGVGVFGAGTLSHTAGNDGWFNTAIGNGALHFNTTGYYNSANGNAALYSNTTGHRNTANGNAALFFNTIGYSNTANGTSALQFNTEGSSNTAIGDHALMNNTTGNNNTANGSYALFNTTGGDNIALGYHAGFNITSGSNNIIIGTNIDAPVATGSNQMSIGNLIYATGLDGTGTTLSTGNVGIGTMTPVAAKLHVDGGAGRAVYGKNTTSGNYGYLGSSNYGVYGFGSNGSNGVVGSSGSGNGVVGSSSSSGNGVDGSSFMGNGVDGSSSSGNGVDGSSSSGNGVRGSSTSGYGVYGINTTSGNYGYLGAVNYGVVAVSSSYTGVSGSGPTYDFYAAGTGVNYGPFTGGHEVRLSGDFPLDVKPGMIVSVTGRAEVRIGEDGSISLSSTLPTVALSNASDDRAVFGALVAEAPLPEDHWYERQVGERFATVNALGEGRVWVSNVNGELKAGDYISTSAIAGYGHRQADDLLHSYTLGKTIETVDWETVMETVEHNGETFKVYLIAVVYTSG